MSDLKSANDCIKMADDIGIFDTLKKLYRRKMVISIPMSAQTAETDFYELNLTIRTYNCLRRAGAETIGDVAQHIANGSIKTVRNITKKCVKEVYKKTLEFCYSRLTHLDKIKFFGAILK